MPGGAPQNGSCDSLPVFPSEKAVTKAATRVNHSLTDDVLVSTNSWEHQLRLQAFSMSLVTRQCS